MKHVKLFEQFIAEKISQDAYQIHVNLSTGQDATQHFIDDNNLDGEKLKKYVIQHKNSAEKYVVRDMINGTQPNPRLLKKFVKESFSRTSNKYKTQNVEWSDIEPGDYIADGPNVREVSRVISNTGKGFTLKRVWNNVRKKDGEEFFIPHDLDAMKDYPNSIIKVVNYVKESQDTKEHVNEGLIDALVPVASKLTDSEMAYLKKINNGPFYSL